MYGALLCSLRTDAGAPCQNGTKAARIALRQKFEAQGVNVFFIGACNARLECKAHPTYTRFSRPLENICDREDIVEANIRSVKISSPDVRFSDS